MDTRSLSGEGKSLKRLRVVVRGAVQGVGFRPFVYRLAREMDLPGWVVNSAEGVFIEVEGQESSVRDFLGRLQDEKPAISSITSLESSFLDCLGFTDFEIRESAGGLKTALILPDMATCPECLRDIRDAQNRRYRYPFTNCTNCGPRFTIIESLPYDRLRTTMKDFLMCQECEREYRDPADRRFHAQPNACPECGPQLELWDCDGEILARRDDALLAAGNAIRDGKVVALKGLGGFHLITDARNETAVGELRRRKRREEKPFALMYPSITDVLRDCHCSEVELRLLRSPECPIVLLRRRKDAMLSPAIAPRNPYVGAMLPYTPLHHLLMQELKVPVVATSGNLSEEPICTDERDALDRLHGIADLFLVHNRPILRHVDDSIVREIRGREIVLRRSRGFAPLPVQLKREVPTIIAVGAHQKNTIASSVGAQVFVSQHIGDLETVQSFRAFEEVGAAFRELYELRPECIARDLHPDYLSSQFASRMPEQVVAVQHHHAHVLSCMAENQIEPPALGVAWDGSGYGPDGTIWGGEFLQITDGGYERVAHLRTFRMPGGEKAVKEPRRTALGILYEMFGNAAFEIETAALLAFSGEELKILSGMLRGPVNASATSSAGRLFDAVASLLGIRQVCGFEGQAAMELEFAAGEGESEEALPFQLRQAGTSLVIDWEPLMRALLDSNAPAPERARMFHNTLAAMVVAVAERTGESKVVLSGGCFQNRYLTERVIEQLEASGFRPYWHQRIPPNDGGISLGQVVAAAAQIGREQRVESAPAEIGN